MRRALLVLSLASLSAWALAQDSPVVTQLLAARDRDIAHLLRDESRKPAAVLNFLAISRGMHILDVYAADGYYSYLFAKVVGPQGRVYAQNPGASGNVEDIRQMHSLADALDATIARAGLTNVTHVRNDLPGLDIEPGSLDLVFMALIFHDLVNGSPEQALLMLRSLLTLLKPDGHVVIIDHAGDVGQDNRRLHRIPISDVMEWAERLGLELVDSSELLANPADRRRRPVFDPMLGRNTDRFLLKFRLANTSPLP